MRKKRFKVLFIATGYPTRDRPNQNIFTHRSIKRLSNYLDVQVIQFRAWKPDRPIVEKRIWDGVNVTTLACPQIPGGSNFHINAKLLSWFGSKFVWPLVIKADLLHSTDLYPSGYVASKWAQKGKKPHTTHVIGSDLNLFLLPKLSSINKVWLNKIAGFACNSLAIKKLLIESVPGTKNLKVIYRGVDIEKFSPTGPSLGPQISEPPVRFLYLGGFHTWDPSKTDYYNLKGGPILLEAWESIESIVQPSNLLVGGPGTDINKLESWRASLKFPNSVHFCDVIVPSNVPSYIRASDVLIIPSTSEGLPNIANEAQACGRPVLGTDAGGIPESVLNGITGKIIQRGNPNKLAEALVWFQSNQDKIKIMGAKGHKRMSEKFSWDNFSKQMIDLFTKAINEYSINSLTNR